MVFSNLNRQIRFGILAILLSFAIQQSPLLLENLVAVDARLVKVSQQSWQLDLGSLPGGTYYVTVGRPHGRCRIEYSGRILAVNYSDFSRVRSELFLGSPLVVASDDQRIVNIYCERSNENVVALTHVPVVAKFYWGILLHFLRIFTYLILGPIAATILIAGSLFLVARARLESPSSPNEIDGLNSFAGSGRFVSFGVCGLIYTMSLAHIPRLVFDEMLSAEIHVVIRHLFSLAFLYMLGAYRRVRPSMICLHLLSIALSVSLYQTRTELVLPAYRWQFWLLVVCSFVAFRDLCRDAPRNRGHDIIRYVAATWAISQIVDGINLWVNFGAYNSPALLAIMCGVLFMVQADELARKDVMLHSSMRLMGLVRSSTSIEEIIKPIANELRMDAAYVRSSAYVDQYVLGATSIPRKRFLRVFQYGYEKDTSRDLEIDFDDSRGLLMQEALRLQDVQLRLGRDNEWFLLVPIGQHICVNLSLLAAKGDYLAYQSEDLLRALRPALNELETKVIETVQRTRTAMHKIRSVRGLGTWNIRLGSVFLDIVQYSDQCTTHGSSYTNFIQATFLPALMRRLSHLAVVEFTKGDEVYFVILSDLLPPEMEVDAATIEVIRLVDTFIRTDGAALAAEKGFGAQRLRVGGAVGDCDLVSTESEVKSAGASVNAAKRLQDAARRGETLISADLIATAQRAGAILGPRRTILEKETVIETCSIAFDLKLKKSA